MEKITEKKLITYDVLRDYVNRLKKSYPLLRVSTCGKSVMGKELFALCLGEGCRRVLYVGGTHANEWITSLLLMDFCEELLKSQKEDLYVSGYRAKELLKNVTLIIIPMLNPDGVDISVKGVEACGEYREQIYDICRFDFSCWTANANGVDLNHNFNADWYSLRDFEEKNGVCRPSPRRFGGAYPESEPEVKAIVKLLRGIEVERLYSFHSQGEEIFYSYKDSTPPNSYVIAQALSGVSGYTLVNNEGHYSSGGLKDWFIEEFKRPGFTIEVGRGKNPLPLEDYEEIYSSLETIGVLGLIL